MSVLGVMDDDMLIYSFNFIRSTGLINFDNSACLPRGVSRFSISVPKFPSLEGLHLELFLRGVRWFPWLQGPASIKYNVLGKP